MNFRHKEPSDISWSEEETGTTWSDIFLFLLVFLMWAGVTPVMDAVKNFSRRVFPSKEK